MWRKRPAALPCDPNLLRLRRSGCLLRPAREYHRVDRGDHPSLHDLILVDGNVPDAGDVLHIDVLQRTVQLAGWFNGLTIAVGNVKIDVFADASGQAGAKYRIQANRQ